LFAFAVLKPKRIKELVPIAIVSIVILTAVDVYIISLNLYKFINPLVNIFGAPLFHLLWAGAAGMIFVHYTKPGFNKSIISIIFFTIITILLDLIAEKAGVATRLGNFNYIHSFILNFGILVILLWISIGLYGKRIYSNVKATNESQLE
jgi:hypothetical protein